ncbi:MAG TPA: hypothetical protein VN875_12245 [Candidatus Binatus sp.]|nr:hypothetical protein [Candidatus Binatus sp.]
MRTQLKTMGTFSLLASIMALAGSSFAQSKGPVVESRLPETSQVAPAGNYHFQAHLGRYGRTADGFSGDLSDVGADSEITAPYGVVIAHGDASWQPSRYVRFSKALATGEREQARQQTPAPMPSLGDVDRERRESKTSDEKPDVVIKQDAKGKPVVVTKQP